MIYFTIKNLLILNYIKRHKEKGAVWQEIFDKFDKKDREHCDGFLRELSSEFYIVTKDKHGNWLTFKENPQHSSPDYISFITDKGIDLLERKLFDFFKWIIPVKISILSLVVSFAALIISA